MKKLLVLLMVLGITSMASAAIKISVDGVTDLGEITILVSDTIVVDISNTGSVPPDFICYLDFYYTSEGTYTLADPRLGPAAGNFPASFVGPYDGGYDNDEVEFTQAWTGAELTTGSIFEVDLHCEGTGDVLVELYDWDSVNSIATLVDTLTIHQIPEPMTIGLLGLGALFLKRRK